MKKITQAEIISNLIIAASNPILLADKNNTIVFANNETESLLGYEKDELTGKPLGTIISARYKDSPHNIHNIFDNLDKDWAPVNGRELFAARKDGSELRVKISLLQMVTAEGMLPLLLIEDVSGLIPAKEKIANNDTRFRVFFDNASEAIVVLDMASLTFVKNNYAALKLFKFSAKSLRKMGLLEVSPEFQPDERRSDEKLKELINDTLHTEKMFFEWQVLDEAGKEILCEVRVVVLPDIEERQLLISFVDIAERKRAENELRADNKRLRFQLENALLGYVEWDDEMNMKGWSKRAEEIFGWNANEFKEKGMNAMSLIPEEEMNRFEHLVRQVKEGKEERITVLQRNYTKDGSIIWCEWFHSVLRDMDGKIQSVMSLVNDVTERKQAEDKIHELNIHLEDRVSERTAELTEVNKGLEAFSYSVSHDLRSPVRAIISFSSIIKNHFSGNMPDPLKEMFEHIESNGRRMDHIIEDLLALAKYGKGKLRPVPVDMNNLVQTVWNNISRCTPHKTKLEIPELPVVRADASLLEQILVNLLSNAIKYSAKKDNPLVQVGFQQDEHYTTFFVKDNGAGFNMQYYDRLFGAFQRLHTSKEFEGTGVGLLLVKRLVEKQGGTIWAESRVNEGATFWFSLPRANGNNNNQAELPTSSTSRKGDSNPGKTARM
jgi:PAS domain S-box-containing protein